MQEEKQQRLSAANFQQDLQHIAKYRHEIQCGRSVCKYKQMRSMDIAVPVNSFGRIA
jgi:hypothetical protein